MMDPAFWLKLFLGFLVGSLWITLTTISAERFGSKVGGSDRRFTLHGSNCLIFYRAYPISPGCSRSHHGHASCPGVKWTFCSHFYALDLSGIMVEPCMRIAPLVLPVLPALPPGCTTILGFYPWMVDSFSFLLPGFREMDEGTIPG